MMLCSEVMAELNQIIQEVANTVLRLNKQVGAVKKYQKGCGDINDVTQSNPLQQLKRLPLPARSFPHLLLPERTVRAFQTARLIRGCVPK